MALRINGEVVSDARFHRAFLQVSGGLSPDAVLQNDPSTFRAMQREAERNVLELTVMLQMAKSAGLSVSDAEIEQERRKLWGSDSYLVCGAGIRADRHDALLCRKFEALLVRHVPRPGKAEVEAVYRQRLQEYAQPERVHAVQIFLPAEKDVEREAARLALHDALHQLQEGKPFPRIMARASGSVTTDLGWVTAGDLVPELETPLFVMKAGEVSPVIETIFGLHLLKVIDRHAPRIQPFSEVKDALARHLLEERRNAVRSREVWTAMQQARIEDVEGALAEPLGASS